MKIFCCLSFSLLPLLAMAADPVPPPTPVKPGKPKPAPEELFARLDKDKNGTLSMEEFRGSYKTKPDEAKLSLAFRKRDSDANGKLTLAEFVAGIPKEEAAPAVEPAPAASGSKQS
jgi:hypothetical protein